MEAREESKKQRRAIAAAIQGLTNSDCSFVVVGSLARQEFTSGSDVDWTLLLDGMSRPQDFNVALKIRTTLDGLGLKQPGREGAFGSIASSHDLVHRIGGQYDTNSNTTLRMLLLLESASIGHSEAYDRVRRNILWRYLSEDRGLWEGLGPYKVPRFLFNDIARYWRTMAVDFAYKQRDRNNEGFALRNLKLRMSRKLLFLAGIALCFKCDVFLSSDQDKADLPASRPVESLIEHLVTTLAQPPLDIVASLFTEDPQPDANSAALFTAYDDFLGILADQSKREHLDKLTPERLGNDDVSITCRDISHRFRNAIRAIFLNHGTKIGAITIEYGVF